MYKRWFDRFKYLLDFQKAFGFERITVSFSRYDLLELKEMIETLLELENNEQEDN